MQLNKLTLKMDTVVLFILDFILLTFSYKTLYVLSPL